jgi:hypothetical protein
MAAPAKNTLHNRGQSLKKLFRAALSRGIEDCKPLVCVYNLDVRILRHFRDAVNRHLTGPRRLSTFSVAEKWFGYFMKCAWLEDDVDGPMVIEMVNRKSTGPPAPMLFFIPASFTAPHGEHMLVMRYLLMLMYATFLKDNLQIVTDYLFSPTTAQWLKAVAIL